MTTSFRTEENNQSGAIAFAGTDNITLKTTGPELLGVPRAPTATAGANTTQIATTQFVTSAMAAAGNVLPSDTTPGPASGFGSPGTSAKYARGDHVHPAQTITGLPVPSDSTPSPISTSGSSGFSTSYSRGDHTHANNITPSSTTPASPTNTGSAGSSSTYSRGDHAHPSALSNTTPAAGTASGSAGSSSNASRSDHSHPAGPQSITSSGYATLPGGLLMQWGQSTMTPAGSNVSFPISFSATPYSITLGVGDNSNPPVAVASVGSPSPSGFLGHCSQSFGVYWLAIGKA